jgi:hypothetical protein
MIVTADSHFLLRKMGALMRSADAREDRIFFAKAQCVNFGIPVQGTVPMKESSRKCP